MPVYKMAYRIEIMDIKITKKEIITMIILMLITGLVLLYMYGWFRGGEENQGNVTVQNVGAHVQLIQKDGSKDLILQVLDRNNSGGTYPYRHPYPYSYNGKSVDVTGYIFNSQKPVSIEITELDQDTGNLTRLLGLGDDSKYVLKVVFSDVKGNTYTDFLQSESVESADFEKAICQGFGEEKVKIEPVYEE